MDKTLQDLEFTLESGQMGAWDVDLTNNKVTCSRLMLELWNVTEKEVLGNRKVLQEKVHPEDLPIMLEAIRSSIEERSVYELEYRIIPTPGKIKWVHSRGRCTFDSGPHKTIRFSGIVFDITEKKMKEEELAAAVKARDQFFMIASHELRTPLACLNLQLEVLQWELKSNHPEIFRTERISSGFKKQQEHFLRISKIVDNILNESKLAMKPLALQKEKFDLMLMVQEVLDSFRIAAEAAGVEILLEKTGQIMGQWDRYRLEQVMLNLLVNAVKYGKKKPVTVSVSEVGDTAIISVKDNGDGIRPEDHQRVFQKYERVVSDKSIKGMGLGLYICDNFVRAHGGEIRLQSNWGEGAEFRVILPI